MPVDGSMACWPGLMWMLAGYEVSEEVAGARVMEQGASAVGVTTGTQQTWRPRQMSSSAAPLQDATECCRAYMSPGGIHLPL